jgi:hypothetical protein
MINPDKWGLFFIEMSFKNTIIVEYCNMHCFHFACLR